MHFEALAWVAFLMAGFPTSPPALLRDALVRHPELALLDPALDLQGDYKLADLQGFGYWPPWRRADFDGDGREDVAAVVVLRHRRGRSFGVLAVHARKPHQSLWVDRLQDDPIYGVAAGPAPDTLVPLHCIECDANAWYRWSGREYEVRLFSAGEHLVVAASTSDTDVALSGTPTRNGRRIARVPPCARARIIRVRGRGYENRWYLVELEQGGMRGWIPASLANEMECIG
jgi:hypothetical protein